MSPADLLLILFFLLGYSISSAPCQAKPSTSDCQYSAPAAHHNTPFSRVIHCRAVADGCKETDLISVLQPFGKIT